MRIRKEMVTMKGKVVRLGAGSAWWGDRVEPAVDLVKYGNLDYLCYETMAEATMSSAQVRMRADKNYKGFDTYLEDRMNAVLPLCVEHGTKIISNQGWANPKAAAEKIIEIAKAHGIKKLKVAHVTGTVPQKVLDAYAGPIMETGLPFKELPYQIIAIDPYIGAGAIVEALKQGADVVITSRLADPSLYVAPLVYEYGWSFDDWEKLGKATLVGHLMECAGQCMGGYYGDPGYKDVPNLARLGFPMADVDENGDAVITKLPDAGGMVTEDTCKEQMLYEIGDPSAYITPDVIADFSKVSFKQVGKDQVRVMGASGKPKTPTIKACVGCFEGYVAEDWFFYAGIGALEKAKFIKGMLMERFEMVNLQADEVRIDFLGVNAVHGEMSPEPEVPPYEIGVRVVAKGQSLKEVNKVVREVDSIAVCGLAGTGKRVPFTRTREIIGLHSILVPREQVDVQIDYIDFKEAK
jgi:hypothetical protein